MLAQRLPSILPPMDAREMLDISMIASLGGELKDGQLTRRRPFRAPHHSASMPALVGGGLRAKPGEMALAHHGVLFLDELLEFQPRVLEALRQPMESGEAVVARANYHITYPACFQLITVMNHANAVWLVNLAIPAGKAHVVQQIINSAFQGLCLTGWICRLNYQLCAPRI